MQDNKKIIWQIILSEKIQQNEKKALKIILLNNRIQQHFKRTKRWILLIISIILSKWFIINLLKKNAHISL